MAAPEVVRPPPVPPVTSKLAQLSDCIVRGFFLSGISYDHESESDEKKIQFSIYYWINCDFGEFCLYHFGVWGIQLAWDRHHLRYAWCTYFRGKIESRLQAALVTRYNPFQFVSHTKPRLSTWTTSIITHPSFNGGRGARKSSVLANFSLSEFGVMSGESLRGRLGSEVAPLSECHRDCYLHHD